MYQGTDPRSEGIHSRCGFEAIKINSGNETLTRGTVVGDNHEQALSRLKSQEVRRQGHRFFDGSDGQRITVISGGGM